MRAEEIPATQPGGPPDVELAHQMPNAFFEHPLPLDEAEHFAALGGPPILQPMNLLWWVGSHRRRSISPERTVPTKQMRPGSPDPSRRRRSSGTPHVHVHGQSIGQQSFLGARSSAQMSNISRSKKRPAAASAAEPRDQRSLGGTSYFPANISPPTLFLTARLPGGAKKRPAAAIVPEPRRRRSFGGASSSRRLNVSGDQQALAGGASSSGPNSGGGPPKDSGSSSQLANVSVGNPGTSSQRARGSNKKLALDERLDRLAGEASRMWSAKLGCSVHCEYLGQQRGPPERREYIWKAQDWVIPRGGKQSLQIIALRWRFQGEYPAEQITEQRCHHACERGLAMPKLVHDRQL